MEFRLVELRQDLIYPDTNEQRTIVKEGVGSQHRMKSAAGCVVDNEHGGCSGCSE